jgi:hypothetical protein
MSGTASTRVSATAADVGLLWKPRVQCRATERALQRQPVRRRVSYDGLRLRLRRALEGSGNLGSAPSGHVPGCVIIGQPQLGIEPLSTPEPPASLRATREPTAEPASSA